jgi:uncharacterized SAM-binding protein YcdF (DUF218 family)
MKRVLQIAALFLTAVLAVWSVVTIRAVTAAIEQESRVDEAAPADVIVVMGAAEYRGKPSPVLEARLNHALALYMEGLAPRILTTGGKGGDPLYTEGEVAHNYLSRHGVPSEAILVESEGESTVHSIAASSEIMQRMGLTSCIVVSDGYHIFRVRKMLERRGIKVYGSPRPEEAGKRTWWVYLRQALAYGLWKIGIPI